MNEILRRHVHLTGVVLEYSAAGSRTRDAIAASSIAGRCVVREGSFFDPLPLSSDVFLLCWILHDWGNAEAVQILERCRAAAEPKGRVLIVERLSAGPEGGIDTELDLRMLVYFGARERTLEEFRALTSQAGLWIRRVQEMASGFSVLECMPGECE